MTSPAAPLNPRHPIGVVAERTGLSEHVLRAWERRYGVVAPVRGEGGHRLYTDTDIRRLTLVNSLTRTGRSVASVAGMSDEALEAMALEDAAQARPTPAAAHADLAMAAVRDLAPDRLEAVLQRALFSLGVMPFVTDVLGPLLTRVGDEWHTGQLEIAHEHAASSVVSQMLARLLGDLPAAGDAPVVVMATPAGERHGLGALIAGVVALHDGWRAVSMGTDLPAAQIATAAARLGARIVAVSVACDGTPGLDREVLALRAALPRDVAIVAGGAGARRLSATEGVLVVRDLAHWRSVLRLHASELGGTL